MARQTGRQLRQAQAKRPALKNADVFLEVASQRAAAQLQSIDALDTKAAGIFAAGTTLVAIVGGFLQLAGQQLNAQATDCLVLGVVAFGVMAAALILAYFTRTFDIAPLRRLQGLSTTAERNAYQDWIAREYVATITDNRTKVRRKSRLVVAGAAALFFEGVFLVLAVVFALKLTWAWP